MILRLMTVRFWGVSRPARYVYLRSSDLWLPTPNDKYHGTVHHQFDAASMGMAS
jgi:hypothetical protein